MSRQKWVGGCCLERPKGWQCLCRPPQNSAFFFPDTPHGCGSLLTASHTPYTDHCTIPCRWHPDVPDNPHPLSLHPPCPPSPPVPARDQVQALNVSINVVGGLRIDPSETGLDLPLLAAVASACLEVPLPPRTILVGEVGLRGEIRHSPNMEVRVVGHRTGGAGGAATHSGRWQARGADCWVGGSQHYQAVIGGVL